MEDKVAGRIMLTLTVLSLCSLLIMGAGLLIKSWPILKTHSVRELVSGTEWSPLSGVFGFWPFILSSIYVTLLAVVITVPVALLTAMFLTENAKPVVRKIIFPILDILAGIPSVVYGLWGILVIIPWIADSFGPLFVDYTSGYTLLAGGIVLGVMIVPLMVSLFIELFTTVPVELKEAAAALGATRWQTTKAVVLRKCTPGIIAAVVLAISKAFGETLAVLMVCGNMASVPHSLFEGAYPLPALIANNYGEMLSLPMYESALMFAAMLLFIIILLFNVVARVILQKIEKRFKI